MSIIPALLRVDAAAGDNDSLSLDAERGSSPKGETSNKEEAGAGKALEDDYYLDSDGNRVSPSPKGKKRGQRQPAGADSKKSQRM